MEQNPNKRKILAEQFGVNPDEYTLSDDGAIATPDTSGKSGDSDSNGSATQAAFTGARKSIGATGAGLGTAAALSWLAGPEVGLPATAAIILSSLGAGYGGGKLQEKIEPAIRGESEEETQARLQQEAELAKAHPVASTVGELAPNLLAFRPSPTALKNVFTGSGAMAKSLGSRIVSPAQKAAMMNVGVNAGIGTGATLATQAVDGQDIDVMEAVKQGAIQGALFHEPWLVGKALGFHPSADLTIPKKTFTGSGLDLTSGTPNVGYTNPIGPTVPGADINQSVTGNIVLGDTAPKASTTLLADREINASLNEARKKQDDFIKARLEQWQQEQSQVSVIPKDTIENPEPTTTFTGSDRKPLTQNQLRITQPSVEKAIEANNTITRPEVREGEGNINDFEQVKQNDINEKKPLTEAEQQQDIFDRNYQNGEDNFNDNVKYWLTPKNTFVNAAPEHAVSIGKLTDYSLGHNDALKSGYVKVTNLSKEIYFKGEPTSSQLKNLRDTAIEQDKKLIQDFDSISGVPQSKVIYDPRPEYNFQKKVEPAKEIVEHAEKTIAIPGLDAKVKAGWEEALTNYKANPELGFKLPKFGNKASGTTRAKVPSTTGGDIGKQPNVFMGLDSEPINTRPFSLPRPIVNHMLKEGLIDNLKANALLKTEDGEAARGVSIGSTRGTEINPTIATADTAAHESTHHYINELLADPKTSPYAKRLIEAAGGEGTIHPESTVEEVGKRVTDLLQAGKNTKFTDTFLANLKQRLGMANNEDVVKILTDHLVNNPSYEERTLGRTINMGSAGKNSQPNPKGWDKVDSLNENSSRHGWLTPDGKYIDIGYDSHESFAKKYLDKEAIENTNLLNTPNTQELKARGYLRIHNGEDTIFAEGNPTSRQAKHLKDTGIELNKSVVSDNGGKFGLVPKDKYIFDRDNRNFQKQVSPQMKEYYQKGIFEPTERMVSPDDLVNHITLGLDSSELHGGKSIVDRLTASLNPFNWTKAETTKIRELNTVEGKTLGNALDKLAADNQLFMGKLRGITDAWRVLNSQERDLLHRTMLAESRNNKSLRDTLPANLQTAYDTYRAAIKLKQENQIAAGELVKDYRYNDTKKDWEPYYREAKINPFYYPNIISSSVFDILAHPGTDVYNKLHDDFTAHQKEHYENLTDKQAEELFREFIEATGGVSKTGSVKFGANRYAEGIGLPDSWIEPDALDASRRYLKRVALDRAFFDNIESKPEVARMAGINLNQIGEPNPTRFKDSETIIKDLSHNPNVRNVLDIVQGKVTQRNPTIDAATSLASSMLLGPVSAIRDFISVPFNIAKYSDFKSLPSVLVSSLTNFREGYRHSFETGFNKHDPTLVHDLFNPAVKAANTIYEARNLLYKVSGRQSIYQMANAWAQSLGEAMMDIHITKAINGDKKSISFLQQLTGQEKFTSEDVAKLRSQVPELATKIGQYAMGTNDFRTLPLWAINSPIAPIFRLARWNIEMTNNFNDHVIKPLKAGNPEPFILATMGSLLGGLMVKKLKEVAYDKKSYLPTLTEMANSSGGLGGNKGNIAYYGMALASYAGYAGILSDFARSSMDIVHKNNPQSFNFPAWGLISDSTARIMDATTAIANGESSFVDVAPRLIADEMKSNFQLARLANTWLFENTGINKEGKQSRETSEKLRDLRTFNQVEGQPTTSTANSTSNPYEKLDVKRFKHETDISQAPEELHNIVGRLIQQHGNNPEELKKQLRGVSANNYQTFPNPKQNPIAFGKYYTYLQNTIGYEAAQQRLQDYLVQNKINTVKSKMVPKIR